MFILHFNHNKNIIFILGPKERDPCSPSPCGPNTICEKIGDTAVCKCLPGLQGIPSSITGCHPECVISSDCPGDKACIGNKCVNPCTQNVCGIKATCKAINHSPLCSCPPPLIGNPFDECIIQIGNYTIFIFVILIFNFLRIFMLLISL